METKESVSIREQNFRLAHNRGWSVQEKTNHLYLFDEENELIERFGGHLSLNQYLREKAVKKVMVVFDTAVSYFYSMNEVYDVVEGTAMAWKVVSGVYKGKLIAKGHCRILK